MSGGTETGGHFRWDRLTPWIVAFLVAAYFVYCTWPGIFVGFDDDDVMNLHFAWAPPLRQWLLSNLVPFTLFYRPMGASYYRLCFLFFGWHPFAFRLVTYGLMFLNVGLVYLLGRQLTRSREVGVIAALLFSFHGELRDVYMSNGTVYDVLCATFSLTLFLVYLRLREGNQPVRVGHVILLVALFIAAVNSKEMAAPLPSILLIYEWIWHRPRALGWRSFGNWLRRSSWIPILLLALSAAAFLGKSGAHGQFAGHPLYTPAFTLHRVLGNERAMIGYLFYRRPVSTLLVVLFYAGLFALAWIWRKRALVLLSCFVMLMPLPIMVIPGRNFFVMYLPMAGIAIYAAIVLVQGRDWLLQNVWKRLPLPSSAWEPERIALFALVAIVSVQGRNSAPETMLRADAPEFQYVKQTHDDILRLQLPVRRNARVLLLRSRYPEGYWGPLQMMQLLYRDRELLVDRPSLLPRGAAIKAHDSYDYILDFDGTKLVVAERPQQRLRSGDPSVPLLFPHN